MTAGRPAAAWGLVAGHAAAAPALAADEDSGRRRPGFAAAVGRLGAGAVFALRADPLPEYPGKIGEVMSGNVCGTAGAVAATCRIGLPQQTHPKATGNGRLKAKGKAAEVTGKLKLKGQKAKDAAKR